MGGKDSKEVLQKAIEKDVIICTDASHSAKHSIASYAFTIFSTGISIRCSGVFHRTKGMKGSHQAELACIGNALSMFLRVPNVESYRTVIVFTDALYVIKLLESKGRIKKDMRPLYDEVNSILTEVRKSISGKIRLKHVKAHKKVVTTAEKMNAWCDQNAKKALLKEILIRHANERRESK